MTALHLPEPGTEPRGDDLGPSLCGRPTVVVQAKITGHPKACRNCLRIKAQRDSHIATRPVGFLEAFAELAHIISGPRTESYPALTPELWRSMRCLGGRSRVCGCECCQIDASNRNGWAQWEAEQTHRPHQRHAYPFGSVNAALELLLRWRQDGPAARSAHGSMQARVLEVGRLGTDVQTTQRTDREDLVTRRATQAHDVERACLRAYTEEQSRRGLSTAQCVTILVASVDAGAPSAAEWAERVGISERAIRALVSHGRKQVKTWLAAVDYIAMPRSRDGLDEEIARLRASMERGAA